MTFKYEITTTENNIYVIKNGCFYAYDYSYYKFSQYCQSFLNSPTYDSIEDRQKLESIKHFIIYWDNTFHGTINTISYSLHAPDLKLSNDYFTIDRSIDQNQTVYFFNEMDEEEEFNLLISSEGEYYSKALKLRDIFSDVTQRMRNNNFNYYSLKRIRRKNRKCTYLN